MGAISGVLTICLPPLELVVLFFGVNIYLYEQCYWFIEGKTQCIIEIRFLTE